MSQTVLEPSGSLAEIEAAASRRETRSHAIDLAINALGGGLEAPLVLKLVSEGLEEDGRLQDALGLAHRATVVAPERAESWTEFSRLLLRLGRREEAVRAARSALAADAQSPAVQMAAAAAFLSLNGFEDAILHAREAARLKPAAAEAISTLAIIFGRLSDHAQARLYAERALAMRPDLPGAEIALARVEIAEDQAGMAVMRLRRLLGRPNVSDGHRAEALTALGDALDIVGDPGAAFASYTASGAVMAKQVPPGTRRAVDHARSLETYFRDADTRDWRKPGDSPGEASGAAGHAFLVGFPRSGTTLLENALARHPRVLALEETDALAECAGDLLADGAALGRLAHLASDKADECRAIYWRRVEELLGEPPAGKIVVDKLPIGTVALPVIARLFPSARILFARRDPRDVTLSCFRRLFGINEVMAEFLTLESTARYYDQVMRLAELYREKLPLEVHVVRHEDVVADFDGELGKALAFLGLDWDPAVRTFAERAIRARTPSATQLAVGLNDKGVGAWRRFERQMAPVLPLLERWVETFAYPATEKDVLRSDSDARMAPIRAAIGKALSAGDWPSVFAKADEAFAAGLDDPMLHRFRGVRAQQEGRLESAIADFQAALADAPGDIGLLSALGLCLARSGRAGEAVARLDEAIALNPTFAPAHFNRAFALEAVGELAGAAESYERAVSLDPRDARAIGALAMLASRRADWEPAKALARKALAMTRELPSASLALAAAEAATGEGAGAEQRLRALIEKAASAAGHEEAFAYGALGDVLDAMGRRDEAFAAYEQRAAAFRAIHGPRFAASGAEPVSQTINRLQHWLDSAEAAPAAAPGAASPSDAPVFLLGFPRSGTTLTGQALGLHPALFTLDEADTLTDSVAAFYADEAGLRRLATLDAARAQPFEELYRRRAQAAGWPADGRRLIDKLPMNTLALPIISKILPDAKAIMMRRDPRDVVLSCFRRQFVINPTTIEFLTLEGAARLYDRAMRLFEACREKLALEIRIQSYEALVGDFEGEMRSVLAFLGLDWDPAVAGFAERSGAVATPSSSQLAAGLNAEGVGAWRGYASALAPVLPILAPWVERFGYATD